MDVKVTDYMPDINSLSQEELSEVRDRLETYLRSKEEFKDLDLRPNSVVGDLILSPLAHIIASLELAMNRVLSDIDLGNVSQGTVYNCDFVKTYLNNFGEGQVYEYPSTGVVQLLFSESDTKFIDYGTKFIFAADGGEYIYELVDVENNITLRSPYEAGNLNDPYEKKLVKIGDGRYAVNLAIKGPAGVGVNADTVPKTDIGHASLIGAKALGDFDRGTLPENVMELARKVQKTYYSSSLNNRTGAVSFLLQTFPEIRSVSAVISGDDELARNRENILGVREGALDLFIKSRDRYLVTEQEIKMVFDNETDTWVGSADLLEPAVWIDGIFRAGSTVNSEVANIFGKSRDEALCPGATSSYSKYEKLGFEITEGVTSDDITPRNIVNGTVNSSQLSTGVQLSLVGQYQGSKFLNEYERNLSLDFTDVFTDPEDGNLKLRGFLRDTDYTYLSTELIFTQNENNTVLAKLENPEDLARDLKGIAINIEALSGTFQSVMMALVSSSTKLKVTGRGGSFILKYRYDPNYSLVDKTMSSNDITPVNTTILTRNFLTCHVYELHVDYKKKTGQNVDLLRAKEEIVNYVNSLTYPNEYEEFTVAEVLLYYGAEGVQRVRQRGQFFTSLANKYVLGSDETVIDVESYFTESLLPPDNVPGMGPRNVNYILDSSNVTFNAIHV